MKKKIFREKCYKIDKMINGEECNFFAKENNHSLELLDYAISQLSEEAQRIIYFDFVYRNNKNWWREFYSKSSYYRQKNIAIDEFIRIAENYKL